MTGLLWQLYGVIMMLVWIKLNALLKKPVKKIADSKTLKEFNLIPGFLVPCFLSSRCQNSGG